MRGYGNLPPPVALVVTVREVANFTFCPRIAYIEHVLNLSHPPTRSMTLGYEAHRARQRIALMEPTGDWTKWSNKEELARKIAKEENIAFETALTVINARIDALNKGKAQPPRKVEVEKHITAQNLGLRGSIDLIEDGTPVELKTSQKISNPDVIQLTLYALLLEHEEKRDINQGIIENPLTGKRTKIQITQEKRKKALETRDNLIKLIHTRKKPQKRNTKKCTTCPLKPPCHTLT
ncbi:MAG: CRISPR-associated protein Cas4 [Candidatus Jordarchaeales archaeon]